MRLVFLLIGIIIIFIMINDCTHRISTIICTFNSQQEIKSSNLLCYDYDLISGQVCIADGVL